MDAQICPLLYMQEHTSKEGSYCIKEECAWWKHEQCAVPFLAGELVNVTQELNRRNQYL